MRVRLPEGFDDGDLVAANELVPPGGVLLVAQRADGAGAGCADTEPYGDTPHVHHWFGKRLTTSDD